MKKQKTPPRACKLCGKAGAEECGRIECGNRRTLTAAPPEQPPGHDFDLFVFGDVEDGESISSLVDVQSF